MPVSKLILIGLDGLEPSLVTRWTAQGHLPNIARLSRTSRFGPLRSTTPFATFPAWTSMLTGTHPGSHGVFDFSRLVHGTYNIEFAGASIRSQPSLPRLASDAGLHVACLGFPATYPPEPIQGVMIGGFDSPVAVSIDPSFVHPPHLHKDIQERFGDYVFADFTETQSWIPGWHDRALRKLHQGLQQRLRIARYIQDSREWDLFMIHFGESDTVSHHFWAFHDPSSPRHQPHRSSPHLQHAILSIYKALDDAVGQLLQHTQPDTHVILASDHGFGGSSDKVFYLNRWLAQRGYLRFNDSKSPLEIASKYAIKGALALLPGRVQQKLWRLSTSRAAHAEAQRRFASIDWNHTQAFSEELNYHPSIRLNLASREPNGIVDPEHAHNLLDHIQRDLLNLRDPWSGQRVVQRAHRREELYTGPHTHQAPEIILDLALDDNSSYNLLASQGSGPVWRRLQPRELLGAKAAGMNGTHRPDGFWLLHGPHVAPRRARAHIADICPTALHTLGLQPPQWMEGSSQLNTHPTTTPIQTPAHTPHTAHHTPYSDAQQAIVEDRLRRLGYF